jgi:hypothetical protein
MKRETPGEQTIPEGCSLEPGEEPKTAGGEVRDREGSLTRRES